MQVITVTIQSLEDVKNGKGIFPDAKAGDNPIELQPLQLGVLEAGMQSGDTSVMLRMRDPETGQIYLTQMSANMLNTLNAGVQGAEQRFAAEKAKRN